MSERIDPKKVLKERREIRLRSLTQLLGEAERLTVLLGTAPNSTPAHGATAPPAAVRHLANMNLGQALWHLGAWLDQSRTKVTVNPPLPVRIFGRLFKRSIFAKGFSIPFQHTAENDAVLVPPPQTTAWEGLARLKEAVGNYQASPRRAESPLFGKLSNEEWDELHLRHAEWHLSFMLEEYQGETRA